jgi:hypothetical protein
MHENNKLVDGAVSCSRYSSSLFRLTLVAIIAFNLGVMVDRGVSLSKELNNIVREEAKIEVAVSPPSSAGKNENKDDDIDDTSKQQPSAASGTSDTQELITNDGNNWEPPQALIDQVKERGAGNTFIPIPSLSDERKGKLLAANHPQLLPAALNGSQFEPKEEWKYSHYADINIVGLPKAGTSHLYQLLVSHPSLVPFHRVRKEFCLPFKDRPGVVSPENLAQVLYEMNMKIKEWPSPSMKKRTVNGCIAWDKNYPQRQYLYGNDPTSTKKIQEAGGDKHILLLRDPADWLWSAYNFWHFAGFDDRDPTKNDWTTEGLHYRSPELFHELLLAGDRFPAMKNFLTELVRTLRMNHDIAKESVAEVLVLKMEDFAPDVVGTSGVLDKLSTFLGVSKDGFDMSIVDSYGNCGDNKGENTKCQTASSAYAVAGGRPMLEKTRKLVHLILAEECQLWADSFGIYYEDCLAVRRKYLSNNTK